MKKFKMIFYIICLVVVFVLESINVKAESLNAIYITGEPTDYEGKAGNIHYFKVTATGTGLSYQWEQSTDGGNSWEKLNGQYGGYNSASMGVTAKSERNGWKFRCVITDASGNKVISKVATIKINEIKITGEPTDYEGKAGNVHYFKVTATGTGLSYQWEQSTDGGNSWEKLNGQYGGYNSASMGVTAKSERNGWKFRCVITDASGNKVISRIAILTIVDFNNDEWETPIL